jgi:hypothetical protein
MIVLEVVGVWIALGFFMSICMGRAIQLGDKPYVIAAPVYDLQDQRHIAPKFIDVVVIGLVIAPVLPGPGSYPTYKLPSEAPPSFEQYLPHRGTWIPSAVKGVS